MSEPTHARFEIRNPKGMAEAGAEGPAKQALTEALNYYLQYAQDEDGWTLWCKVGKHPWKIVDVTLHLQ